jgi:LAS superfamily LD-carboxypeptidase LdcB
MDRDKAIRAAKLTTKQVSSHKAADRVAELLRQGRASEVTNDLLDQADQQRLHHHYVSGNTGMDMPMDQASRMERAAQMGYINKEYRGVSGGGDRSAPRKSYDGEEDNNLGFWTSNNPYVASTYAHQQAGSVYPFLTKEPNGGFPEIDVEGGNWLSIPKESTIRRNGINIPLSEYAKNHGEDYSSNEIARGAVQKGDSGVKFKNMRDPGGYDHSTSSFDTTGLEASRPSDITARIDTSGIRSQFARFDPRLSHLSHLSASTGGAMGKGDEFETSTQDASHIFGNGAVYKFYKHPKSCGYIQVLQRSSGPASVIGLEVPEEFRGQGIGQALQAEAMKNHPSLMGQVSSKAAATTAYRLGRRPYGNPNASLDDVFKGIDENSSINLMTSDAQPKSRGGALELARAITAKNRAGGQIAPSKYMPNVPRAVHADGGKVAYHATYEPFEDYDWSRLGQSTKENTSGTSVEDWALSLASLGPWSHEKPLSKRLGMKTDLPVTLTGKEKKFKSLDHLAQEISQHGGPAALREKLVSQGYGHASVDDEEFGGKSYVGLSPDHFKITKAEGGRTGYADGGRENGEVVNLGKEKLVRSITKAVSDVKSGAHQERMDQRAYKLHESGHLPLPIGTKVTPPQGWDMPSQLQIHGYWQDILHPEQHGYKLKSESGDLYEVQHQMHSGQNPYVFGGGFKAYSGPVRNRAGYSDEAMAPRNPILPTRTPEQSSQINAEYDQLFGTQPDMTKAEGGAVTDTDEFRNWFGNSVTHTNGDPHVLYTGTSKDKDFTSHNVGRHGAWFVRDPEAASSYAEQNDSQGYKREGFTLTPTNTASRVIPAYVKAENPYTGELPEEYLRDNYKAAQSDWFDTLRAKGHDSWIPASQSGNLVVALKEPQQIKSIFNSGKFDPNQKHMNKATGGPVMGYVPMATLPTRRLINAPIQQQQPQASAGTFSKSLNSLIDTVEGFKEKREPDAEPAPTGSIPLPEQGYQASGMYAPFQSAIDRMIADAPGKISVASGYRTPQRQEELWNEAAAKYPDPELRDNYVARAGQSSHNYGLAADLSYADEAALKWAQENAAKYGLNFRMGHEDWHIEPANIWDLRKAMTVQGYADGGNVMDDNNNVTDLSTVRAKNDATSSDHTYGAKNLFSDLASQYEESKKAFDMAYSSGAFDNFQLGDTFKSKTSPNADPIKVVGFTAAPVERYPQATKLFNNHYPVLQMEVQNSDRKTYPTSLENFENNLHKYDRIAGKPRLVKNGGGSVDDDIPNIKNPMSVFPKPQRMFPEDQRPAGGQYISAHNKADVTGHKAESASIGIGPNGKPFFQASQNAVDQTGTSGRGSATVKTNLFKKKAGWKWEDTPEGHENTDTIVSVEHRGKHIYALNAHFPRGVDLARYENSPSEPRLRPTTQGNVTLGPQAGSINVRGKMHPVYHHVIVKAEGGAVDSALSLTRGFTKDGKSAISNIKPKGK